MEGSSRHRLHSPMTTPRTIATSTKGARSLSSHDSPRTSAAAARWTRKLLVHPKALNVSQRFDILLPRLLAPPPPCGGGSAGVSTLTDGSLLAGDSPLPGLDTVVMLRSSILCVLKPSLFHWYWIATSDAAHYTARLVKYVPSRLSPKFTSRQIGSVQFLVPRQNR